MKVLMYIWQLPQNLLGLLVILVTGAKFHTKYWFTTRGDFGISLGNYIILGSCVNDTDIKHEQGHQKQSEKLGWLYLLVVGVPSIVRNIWDRIAHKKWSYRKRDEWYYSHFPEKQADELGGVKRFEERD